MRLTIGSRLAYAYTGGRKPEGPGVPVVFIHGAQHDHSVWILQSRYLAHHGHPVFAVDLPGHGRSAGPAPGSVEAMADWVLEVLRAMGVAPACLVGHSMGSLIAIEAAARGAGQIAGIALLGTAAPMRVSDALLGAARDDEPRAFDMINAWSHSAITVRPGCPGPGFSIFNQNRRLMERQSTGLLFTDFSACNAYQGAVAAAGRLQCPALFVSGRRDLMTPPRAARALFEAVSTRAQEAALPAPQWIELPECGHAMLAEQPQAVLAALKGFLPRCRLSQTTST